MSCSRRSVRVALMLAIAVSVLLPLTLGLTPEHHHVPLPSERREDHERHKKSHTEPSTQVDVVQEEAEVDVVQEEAGVGDLENEAEVDTVGKDEVAASPETQAPAAVEVSKKKGKSHESFIQDLVVGGISGAIAKTATAPIERVKLIMQTQDDNPMIITGQLARYTGIGDCFYRIIQEQGFFSLWRGNLVNVLRYFPTSAFNFAFKDTIKSLFPKFDPTESFLMFFICNVLSGGLAGACAMLIVYPLDFARTRLAADVDPVKREFDGFVDCLVKIARKGGVLALYQGFVVSVYGIVIYRGAYFGMYDSFKARLLTKESYFATKFVLAQAVTTLAGLFAYPFDTIRRRMMMQPGSGRTIGHNGSWDAICHIYKNEGMHGFFKGCWSNIIRGVGAALVLVIYDEVQNMLAGL